MSCDPPRVLNKLRHDRTRGSVYIGRGSPWGNPYRIGPDGGRDTCIEKYRAYLCDSPDLLARLPQLRGRDLVCFCKPKACHGDVLLQLANDPAMTGLLLKRRAAPPTSFKPRPAKTPVVPVDRSGVGFREIVADTEGDNLLRDTTKLHLLQFAIIDDGEWDGQVYTFRNNDDEDSIEAGLEWLLSADLIVFHNAIGHDLPVIEKLYPDFVFPDHIIIRDTLVLSRMICADEKDRDFRRIEKGTMPGKYLGQHSVGAWGARFGQNKGDYADVREEAAKAMGLTDKADIHRYVWGEWNQDMEDYGEGDVKIGVEIWKHLKSKNWAETAVRLEHRCQHIMFLTEQFGFPFDREGARRLEAEVSVEYEKLTKETEDHFGFWYAAKKWVKDQPPRTEYGEDDSRRVWAEVTNPTKTIRYKDPMRPDRVEGEPFCPVVQKEFNPRSRPMIIDRLKTIYQWEPVDFTEKGNPTLDEDVMGNLAKHIPICESLSEIFFLGKLLGALSTGNNAWLTKCGRDGHMHAYINCGGTGTGRASHSSPNIAQVPKVQNAKVRNEDGSYNKKVIDKKTGLPYPWVFKEDGTEKKSTILYGRAGRYGFECRSLFHAPPGWVQVGADLKGVELRCLAARLSPWDGGAYIKEVLEGDPHTKNWHAFKVETRDQAKTLLYAIMYGAGDEKAGSIALPPSASAAQMKAHGKVLKANLQKGIPAFGHLMKKVAKDAKRGYMDGLDGRKVWVRSSHAALNYQLQSDGAILAKAWVVIAYDMIEEAGYVWGVDFAFAGWIHDEIQAFARTREIAEHIAKIMCDAALEAGAALNYPAPIEADAKIGLNWAECH